MTAPTPDANDPSAQEGLAKIIGGIDEDDWSDLSESARDACMRAADAILRAGFGPVRAIEAERDAARGDGEGA